jgi:hypothetical protein
MRTSTPAAVVLALAAASAAVAGPSFHVHYAAPYPYVAAYPVPYPYPVPYGYPVAPGWGWQPPLPYGAPPWVTPGWYGYDPDYLYRMQPGFRFHEPEGRRGFGIRGYTLPGGP